VINIFRKKNLSQSDDTIYNLIQKNLLTQVERKESHLTHENVIEVSCLFF